MTKPAFKQELFTESGGSSNAADRPNLVVRLFYWIVRKIKQIVIWTIALVLLALLTSAVLSTFRKKLEPWQASYPKSEFTEADYRPDMTLNDYLAIEDRVFSELPQYMVPGDSGRYSKFFRYVEGSSMNPLNFEVNWNRTIELAPDKIRGGILLLHGLSDSPYSTKHIGEVFNKYGFYVLNMRMPGHGTVPAGLLDVRWQDWYSAVRIGAKHVREKIGKDAPFFIGGYSNGGALALYYTSNAILNKTDPIPEQLFLFSPAVGITAFARASNWHKLFTWHPLFEKNKWLSLELEYDPYKYNSFTKNAGAQSWYLSKAIQHNLDRVADADKMREMPPVITFQSAVDATIVGKKIVTDLYQRLPNNGSELVVFDVNHEADLIPFFSVDPHATLRLLEFDQPLNYAVTIVTNRGGGYKIVAKTRQAGETTVTETPLGREWPFGIFSLSHVAIPFAPEDPIYGDGSGAPPGTRATLGTLAPRGERDVLSIAAGQLMRLRYNPFFFYIEQQLHRHAENAVTRDKTN